MQIIEEQKYSIKVFSLHEDFYQLYGFRVFIKKTESRNRGRLNNGVNNYQNPFQEIILRNY